MKIKLLKDRLYNFILILISILTGVCSGMMDPEFKAENLACEYMKNALIAIESPRFSWEISSTQNEQIQTAWQLIVSDNLEKKVC